MDITTLSTTEIAAIIALVVVLIAGIAVFLWSRKRRTARLRDQFGVAEYTRAVHKDGDRRADFAIPASSAALSASSVVNVPRGRSK